MSDFQKCLVPGCPEEGRTRGCCFNHYQQARRLVTRKKITWDELIELGKVKSISQKQPSASGFFLDGEKNTERIVE